MFNLNIPTERKLKHLEKFYLTGTQIKKEVNLVQNLAQEMYDFFVSAFGLTPEEVDQLEKKNAEQAEEILNKDKEIEKLKVLLAQKE